VNERPHDGIWLFDLAVLAGAALLGVCAMVGICVIVLSLTP
jgi:hypothetical protein